MRWLHREKMGDVPFAEAKPAQPQNRSAVITLPLHDLVLRWDGRGKPRGPTHGPVVRGLERVRARAARIAKLPEQAGHAKDIRVLARLVVVRRVVAHLHVEELWNGVVD